ncbi:hypothetical protein GS506_15995 [Rhodococcus hoagii]|nr:hypothetical protein [Prescottella equi]
MKLSSGTPTQVIGCRLRLVGSAVTSLDALPKVPVPYLRLLRELVVDPCPSPSPCPARVDVCV